DTGSLVFTGTAEAGCAVSVTLAPASVIGTALADASGAWTLTYAGPTLGPGSHSFTATATDLAGNTGPASAASTVDTSLTTPTITAITDDTGSSMTDGVTSDNTLVIRGAATAGNTITVKILGGATLGTTTADGAGQWSFDHTGVSLADGAYSFAASASQG